MINSDFVALKVRGETNYIVTFFFVSVVCKPTPLLIPFLLFVETHGFFIPSYREMDFLSRYDDDDVLQENWRGGPSRPSGQRLVSYT